MGVAILARSHVHSSGALAVPGESIPSPERVRVRGRKGESEFGRMRVLNPEMAASGRTRAWRGAYELLRLSNQINTSHTIPTHTRQRRRPPPPPAPAPPRQSEPVPQVTLVDHEPPNPPPPPPAAPAAAPISIPEPEPEPAPEPASSVPDELADPAVRLPEQATPYNEASVSKVPSSKFGRLLHYGGTSVDAFHLKRRRPSRELREEEN